MDAHDRVCEQGQPSPLRAPGVDRLDGLLAQRPDGERLIVGLAGLPGAGKSTLAQIWVDQINRQHGAGTAMVIGMDGFHLTRAQLAAMPDPQAALARRGAPWTFDPQALAQRLQQIRDLPCTHQHAGGPGAVSWPGFSHGVGDPQADAITIASSVRLVVLEGLYLLHREHGWNLSGLMHACGYLDVPLERAMERLTQRHMATRGISRAQASARIDANDRLNAHIVAASAPCADWRVADRPG